MRPRTATVKQAFLQSTGASRLHARGVVGTHRPGTPTRVALVDTGVDTETATTGDLAGRVVPVVDPRTPGGGPVACVDLSGESSCDDDYGHGTFMAGLIAGSGAASGGRFSGTAPGAELVSIKIAGRSGASDVTRVLAAVQWAVSFRERYDIGVLNLSLGTSSRTDPRIDPLNRAVQRAWDSGIVVVAAAGNSGSPEAGQPWTISKPADDPLVLTVGTTDDRETPATADDRVPRFSSRGGPGLAKPDVVAPGAHVVSLRAVGSTVDGVGTPLDGTYRRGSGTSMSAAVVSGAVALLREVQPTWTPDQVKHALRTTARRVALDDPYAVGTGLPDVERATSADLTGAAQPRTAAVLGGVDGTGHDWTATTAATTGPATTGPATTGPRRAGTPARPPVTTGRATTGRATTGRATTGPATTGRVTTGPAATGPRPTAAGRRTTRTSTARPTPSTAAWSPARWRPGASGWGWTSRPGRVRPAGRGCAHWWRCCWPARSS